ncbi:hypothetical protein RGUI_0061 (plasmid) [Rhodovulum sp. P5]|nr:hypothetical protein RGUI_0061 [Rhodovulum sp. P5]
MEAFAREFCAQENMGFVGEIEARNLYAAAVQVDAHLIAYACAIAEIEVASDRILH